MKMNRRSAVGVLGAAALVATSTQPVVAGRIENSLTYMGDGSAVDFTSLALTAYCTGVSSFKGFVGIDRHSRLSCCIEQMWWGVREWRRIYYYNKEEAKTYYVEKCKDKQFGERFYKAVIAISGRDPNRCLDQIKSIADLHTDAIVHLFGARSCRLDIINHVSTMDELDVACDLVRRAIAKKI